MAAEDFLIAGRFRLDRMVGYGATGNVYTGIDVLTGEVVAIKQLRSDLTTNQPEIVERFRREGEALRRLNHPNIVKVLATAEEDGRHFIVMEYMPGGSLANLLKKQPQMPFEQVVAIGLELSDALSRAHHLDILHRDIKPANILLAADGTPRLTDFGLVRIGALPRLTTVGEILGTFHYLSPESVENQPIDARADIWAFGVVLFEMLTGRVPFDGDSPIDLIWTIKHLPLPEMDNLRKGIPASLASLVRHMLQKDRLARLGSARQVGAELEAIQKELKTGRPRPQPRAAEGVGLGQALPPATPPSAPPPAAPGAAPVPAPANAAAAAKIRILIVDDHAIVRQGLRMFIDLQDDMHVVAEGTNGLEAIALAGQFQPDIVLLDLVMPQMDGVEATARIKTACPGARVLILTSFGEDDKVFPAIRAGAQGYLLKDIRPIDLVQAVREAYQGKVQLHPDIAQKLMAAVAQPASPPAEPPPAPATRPAPPAPPPIAPQLAPQHAPQLAPQPAAETGHLTERELEVLRLIAAGKNNREIAAQMVISEKTVKTHVSSILSKLGLEDRTQAAIWALKHGIG